MAVEDAVRFGCVFCGHRQPTDAVCGACQRDRTLDLRDAGVRDLFRDTEVRAREQREGTARMIGALTGAVALLAFFFFPLGQIGNVRIFITGAGGVAIGYGVMTLAERVLLRRRRFPWLDRL